MAQQTAVEWLIEQVNSEQYQIAFGQTYICIDLIEQAKQMEKEQMKNMWKGGQWSVELGGKFEQYYNKTFTSIPQGENPSAIETGQS